MITMMAEMACHWVIGVRKILKMDVSAIIVVKSSFIGGHVSRVAEMLDLIWSVTSLPP